MVNKMGKEPITKHICYTTLIFPGKFHEFFLHKDQAIYVLEKWNWRNLFGNCQSIYDPKPEFHFRSIPSINAPGPESAAILTFHVHSGHDMFTVHMLHHCYSFLAHLNTFDLSFLFNFSNLTSLLYVLNWTLSCNISFLVSPIFNVFVIAHIFSVYFMFLFIMVFIGFLSLFSDSTKELLSVFSKEAQFTVI